MTALLSRHATKVFLSKPIATSLATGAAFMTIRKASQLSGSNFGGGQSFDPPPPPAFNVKNLSLQGSSPKGARQLPTDSDRAGKLARSLKSRDLKKTRRWLRAQKVNRSSLSEDEEVEILRAHDFFAYVNELGTPKSHSHGIHSQFHWSSPLSDLVKLNKRLSEQEKQFVKKKETRSFKSKSTVDKDRVLGEAKEKEKQKEKEKEEETGKEKATGQSQQEFKPKAFLAGCFSVAGVIGSLWFLRSSPSEKLFPRARRVAKATPYQVSGLKPTMKPGSPPPGDPVHESLKSRNQSPRSSRTSPVFSASYGSPGEKLLTNEGVSTSRSTRENSLILSLLGIDPPNEYGPQVVPPISLAISREGDRV